VKSEKIEPVVSQGNYSQMDWLSVQKYTPITDLINAKSLIDEKFSILHWELSYARRAATNNYFNNRLIC